MIVKLIKSDGKKLEVRDVGGVIYSAEAYPGSMLPLHGYKIMSDDDAREFLRSNKSLMQNVKTDHA